MKLINNILFILLPFFCYSQIAPIHSSVHLKSKELVFDSDLPLVDYSRAIKSEILATNGRSDVTVLNRADWYRIYSHFENSKVGTKHLKPYNQLFQDARRYTEEARIYPIHLLDINFKLENSNENGLRSEIARTVSSMILSRSIVGDEIDFVVPDEFVLTNNGRIRNIEIDFDNGRGFLPMEINTVRTVNYKGQRKVFLEIIVRFRDFDNEYTYAHFTLQRKSTKIVPSVEHIKNFNLTKDAPSSNHEFTWFDTESGNSITATILYGNDQNGINKLRRPIIITDGFDPGDLRTYDNYNTSSNLERVETRGLYEFVNGDMSPWEAEPSANFISKLESDGFDIVFINFEKGADDIVNNGKAFKNFLNNIINSPTYRDSKTEMNIIVGPSMGGLITRYALKTLEDDGIPHFTKTWIAFDSPMKGAYIPISLQYAVEFMDTWGFGISNAISEAKIKLESPAAKQQLRRHFDPSAFTIHYNFYNTMLYLGYPELLKRYAITNGGKSRLFPHNPVGNYENVLFKFHLAPDPEMFGNSMHNTNSATSYRLFRGVGTWGTTDKYVDYNIAYDGSVGGYNTGLYSISGDDFNNLWDKDPNNSANFPWMKATFIPVSSALGFEPTPSNIFDSWEDFSTSSSPFDEFFGMENNEEHVNISQSTADDVIDRFFRPDFDDGQIPFNRNGNSDIIFDKPVAFTHRNTASFGGNGNSVEFQDGTDVNIKAGDWVRFESDVYIKSGAKISINTEPINYSTVFRSSKARPGLDPLAKSESRGKVYNYETEDGLENVNLLTVVPNPAQNFIQLTNKTETQSRFRIMNTKGEEVKVVTILSNSRTRIDITDLPYGNYIIVDSNTAQVGKFIKL